MPGKMGKDSLSKETYASSCEEVDVKVLGKPQAKRHAKRVHHKALRKRGKQEKEKEVVEDTAQDPPGAGV